ncbi:NUDIX domain-containing protein [Rhizobium daejeonense]|uniref:GDP-mannose pyrophosphatase n=1 Tax=Rhizobium daejeonense TaxID=240521 RepID=A0A6M1S0A9_9HYPH|nr:NUDIX domain-containing protein [Rhizobium daejeonense]NGO64565.1 NUDIX domain-containing protein [Rhizobium daejeonense]
MSRFDRTNIDIVSDEVVWKGWSTLRRVVFDYGRDGHTTQLEWEVFDRGEAVAVLIYDPRRDVVVLVRQFRIPVHLQGEAPFLLEVPAGSMERGEDPEKTVIREAHEETGFGLRRPRRLFSAYMSPGAVTEKIHFFYAQIGEADRVADGGGLDEEHEDIELVELTLATALAMIESGEILDAKTIMLLQWAALNREHLAD